MPDPSRIVRVSGDSPDARVMERAADSLRGGGMVIFPARCLYGLAVDAGNADAVARIFEAKLRPLTNPVLVLIPSMADLGDLATAVPDAAHALMTRFWPGDITLVLEAAPKVPSALTAGTGRIGVRLPRHPVARALVKAAGRPLTGTSANISGRGGCSTVDQLDPDLVRRADMVLDAGPLMGGAGSTVVDVTVTPPRILRQGSAGAGDISRCLSGLG